MSRRKWTYVSGQVFTNTALACAALDTLRTKYPVPHYVIRRHKFRLGPRHTRDPKYNRWILRVYERAIEETV